MQKNLVKILLSILALSCVFYFYKKLGKTTPKPIPEVTISNQLPEDFHKFYNNFHTDSVFQMDHIVFPLKGQTPSQDTIKLLEDIFWQQSNWIIHRPFDSQSGTFIREFTNINGIVSEHISANGGILSLEKRYAKLNNIWHLIYYQEMVFRG